MKDKEIIGEGYNAPPLNKEENRTCDKEFNPGKPYCTVCSRMALDTGIDKFVLWHGEGICEYPTDRYNKLSYEYVHTA